MMATVRLLLLEAVVGFPDRIEQTVDIEAIAGQVFVALADPSRCAILVPLHPWATVITAVV